MYTKHQEYVTQATCTLNIKLMSHLANMYIKHQAYVTQPTCTSNIKAMSHRQYVHHTDRHSVSGCTLSHIRCADEWAKEWTENDSWRSSTTESNHLQRSASLVAQSTPDPASQQRTLWEVPQPWHRESRSPPHQPHTGESKSVLQALPVQPVNTFSHLPGASLHAPQLPPSKILRE